MKHLLPPTYFLFFFFFFFKPLGHIYQNISHDGSQWKKRLSNRLNQQEIEKNRATPHHENASRKRPRISLAQTKERTAKWPEVQWDTRMCRFIASACLGLMFQLWIALRARARPRKSHKTTKSSERFAEGPTTSTRYLPSCHETSHETWGLVWM